MDRSALAPKLMIAFALIGLAVALYDSYSIYNDQLLWCPPPINGCNEVAASPYARIFDLPFGYYGVVYYVYMFGLAALLAYDPLSRGLRIGAVLYTVLGVLFSFYFMVLRLHSGLLYILPDLGGEHRRSYRSCGVAFEVSTGRTRVTAASVPTRGSNN
jgi:uncharacterized membrane protein